MSKYYGLMDSQGNLIGLDSASGGYPFPTNSPHYIQWWKEKKERDAYNTAFKNIYRPVTLEIIVKHED